MGDQSRFTPGAQRELLNVVSPRTTRAAGVVALLVVATVITGRDGWTLALSAGAIFVALVETTTQPRCPWPTLALTTATVTVAATIGCMVQPYGMGMAAAAVPVAFACGLSGAAGRTPLVIGLVTLACFTMSPGFVAADPNIGTSVGLVAIGCVLQSLSSIAQTWLTSSTSGGAAGATGPATARGHQRPDPGLLRLTHYRQFLVYAGALTVIIAAATALADVISNSHAYWLPMGAAWMARPDAQGNVPAILPRLLSAIAGLAVMFLLVLALPQPPRVFLGMAIVGATLAICFIATNYPAAMNGITVWIISLVGLEAGPDAGILDVRLACTVAAAGLIALIVRPLEKFRAAQPSGIK